MIVECASIAPVPTGPRAAIQCESDILAEQREWWRDGFAFYRDPDRPGHLVGSARLLVTGYGDLESYVEIDPVEDRFMAGRDLRFVLDTLHAWARDQGVPWRVSLDDGTFGDVTADGPDRALLAAVEALQEDEGLDPYDLPAHERRAAEIAAQHAGRR